jgi:hypothetical protein
MTNRKIPGLWVKEPKQAFEIPNIDFSQENFPAETEAKLRNLISELETVIKIINENSPPWLRLQAAFMLQLKNEAKLKELTSKLESIITNNSLEDQTTLKSQINAVKKELYSPEKIKAMQEIYSKLDAKVASAYATGKSINLNIASTRNPSLSNCKSEADKENVDVSRTPAIKL